MPLFDNPFRLATRMRREQARLARLIDVEYNQQNRLLERAQKVVNHLHEVRDHLNVNRTATAETAIDPDYLATSVEVRESGEHQHAEISIQLAGKVIGSFRIYPRSWDPCAYMVTGRYYWFLRRALNRLDRLIARKEVARRILLARAQPVLEILHEAVEACSQHVPVEIRPEYYPHAVWSVEYDRVIIWVRHGHHNTSIDVYTRHYTIDDHSRYMRLEDMVPALHQLIQVACST